MKHRFKTFGATCAVAALLAPAAADAAPKGPPLPKAAGGAKVKVFSTGVAIPTQVAFSGKTAFVAGAAEGPMKGGLYAVKPRSKKAVLVKKSPKSAFGVAVKGGQVYVSAGRDVIRFTGWNGKGFRKSKKIFAGPKKFTGFSGLAFGPDGRLYAGVALNQKYDHAEDPSLYGNSVVSMTGDGKDVKVVTTGLRQPWMLTFAKGNPNPFVSDLGPDLPANNGAPDLIVNAAPGDDYGFPACDWLDAAKCEGFTEPLVKLDAVPVKKRKVQQSPMGIGSIGDDLYVALFSAMKVVRLKTDGTGIKPFMTGFVAPVLSVATNKGKVYVGDLTGSIYEVKG
ncbi:MAG TPA: hypothetical protein VMF31_05530 [Solirubrobacterales bacterium]|nr:hypothetical protein [Solirubrobacterales bacterium]